MNNHEKEYGRNGVGEGEIGRKKKIIKFIYILHRALNLCDRGVVVLLQEGTTFVTILFFFFSFLSLNLSVYLPDPMHVECNFDSSDRHRCQHEPTSLDRLMQQNRAPNPYHPGISASMKTMHDAAHVLPMLTVFLQKKMNTCKREKLF